MNEMAATKAPREFETRVLAMMPKLKRIAIVRCGNATDADDLVQETVLKALSKHHQFQDGTNLEAWLTTILRNDHLSRYRKKREVEDPDGAMAANLADDSADKSESSGDLDHVMSLLESLDPQTKAIMLQIADGDSYEEAATKHGIAVGTVKSRVARTRQILLAARNTGVPSNLAVKEKTGLQEITRPVYLHQIDSPDDKGPPPILRWLPIYCLRIDPTYQREILDRGKANVAQIAGAFNWNKFGTVIVAPCGDDLFAIIDGQHRTTAANLCGISHVPCQVIDASAQEQAAAFAAINGNVTALSPMQIHHAKVAAGDEETTRLEAACKAADVRILRYPVPADKIGPGQTMAVKALRNAMRKHGPVVLAVALSCLSKTRGGNPGLYRQQIIGALTDVLSRHPQMVADPVRAIDRAKSVHFAKLWNDASLEANRDRKSVGSILHREFSKLFEGAKA